MRGPVSLRYASLAPWLLSRIQPLGFDPEVVRGPVSYAEAAGTVNRAVALTPGGGPGYILEAVYDRQIWSVDIAGEQGDMDDAEELAAAVDWAFDVPSPIVIDGVRVLSIGRTGGRPTVVGVDNADRWHLAGSYLVQVESGI